MSSDEANRVAIVTGVTGKFGRGIGRELARLGWNVLGTGRRADRGAVFEEEIRSEGGVAKYVQGDVAKVTDCRKVVDTAIEMFGHIDLVVNNAATLTDPPFLSSHDVREDDWDRVLDTNLKGAFFCATFALEVMLQQGSGHIVNVGSAHGLNVGPPRMAAYIASKAALIALTKTMAVEYASKGIRINVIILGAAEGEAGYQASDARARDAHGDDYGPIPYDERHAGGVLGEELARTIQFLTSDNARHINGAAVPVDDGLTAGTYWNWVSLGLAQTSQTVNTTERRRDT